ncbi:fluoride efflux transporter CrcB [Anoxybacteroides tepidamans]|uniref:fluoride efflux transporter CrcB n=1 Tax=Anoxybacteroides tepidamans TaxID=265948 RepID=UPI000480DA7B|nr:fluoride efflux transporter CrcB [Anoxybacillus tepidamans]
MNLMTIALGGAVGAYLRYCFGKWFMSRNIFPAFPLAMVLVNGIGSFGLGMVTAFTRDYHWQIPHAVTIGFFGAFTTFSTFSIEAIQLLREKQYTYAFIYIVLSIFGSIALFVLAYNFL